MGKVEVKQTPRRLNPYGEKLMKIWYDDSMPPKKYIWYKDEEYHFWNGEYWEPFELGDSDEGVNNKDNNNNGNRNHGKCDNHCNCNCECCEEIKFEKFKKEVLSAVLRMIKGHEQESPEELEDRIEQLEANVESLMQINHDLFVKNTELESLLEDLGYIKEEDIADLEVLSGLDDRLNGIERGVSDNTLNIRNFNTRISNLENAGFVTSDALNDYATKSYVDNSGFITSDALDAYATKNYVDNAISNINVPTKVSDLDNDMGFVSGVEVNRHEEDEPVVISNGDIVYLFDDIEYDREGDGYNKLYVSMMPHQISIEVPEADPYDDSAIRERVDDLENRADSVEGRADTLETKSENLESRIESIEGDYIEIEKEQVISASLNDLNDKIVALDERVSNLENEESGGDEPDPDDPPTPVDYVLTYDWNGGEEGPEDVHSSENTATVSESVPRKEGYSFNGWEGPQGEVYWGGDSVTLPITLTALWSFDYPEGGLFTYQAPQAEDSAKLINNDESLTYDTMYEMLQKMYNEGTYLNVSGSNSWFDFYPEPQGDDETNLALHCNMWTGEGDESVYAYLEQEEGGGFRFSLDRTLVEEVYDEETGESSYYQDLADGTELSWYVSQGE